MSKVIYNTATSFNGYIADEENSLEWLFNIKSESGPDHNKFLENIGVLVSGSTTYEWVIEHEDLIAHPEKWPTYYGDRPYFVFSSRNLVFPEGSDIRLKSGGVKEIFNEILDAAQGKDIWLIGGGELVGQFYDAGLLDEIQISMTPVSLASGAPLFPRTLYSEELRLENVEQYDQFLHLTFKVIKK